ncbi:transglycosylase family protein [Corynebacterium sp. AOP40-9SA-29]|uniref:transglycosylase family protein n=1 Tax=Corynebacterium sp. AOP40-9SA-29 TaxID=3457677 RepID=UPI004034DF2B
MSPKKKSTLHRINSTSSVPLRAATGGMLAVLVVGGTVVATNHKDVTLDVNGKIVQASAMSGDIRGLLEDNDVEVADRDMITPGLDEKVEDNGTVTVRSARQVAVTVDGQLKDVDTTSLTVADLLSELGYGDNAASLSEGTGTQIPVDGMELNITTPRDFTLNDGNPGEEPARLSLAAATVGEALELRGTPLGEDDVVTPSADTPLTPGTHIEVHRVTSDEVTEERPFDPPVTVEEDPDKPEGEEEVVEEGSAGLEKVTYKVTTTNGEETGRDVVDRTELEPATERIVIRGTKKASSASAAAVAGGSVWDELVQCEATGDWSANTGNGFSGGLQFTPSTWAAYGGTEYAAEAHMASREQQIAVAEKVQAAQGWGAWPACTSKMGLS